MPRTRYPFCAPWIAAPALLLLVLLGGSARATEEMAIAPSDTLEAYGAEDLESSELDEPLANGHVARAIFTTGIADREPQDEVMRLSNESSVILFFTDLRDLQGQTVTHVWERDGEVVAEVPFSVGAPRWRVYSSKKLEPSWTGEWSVKVVDASGQVIHAESFEYVAAAQPEAQAPPAAMPRD